MASAKKTGKSVLVYLHGGKYHIYRGRESLAVLFKESHRLRRLRWLSTESEKEFLSRINGEFMTEPNESVS